MAEIEIRNEVSELPRIVEFVDTFVASEQIAGPAVMRLHLVLEELIANVIHHGYPEPSGCIRLTLDRVGDRVRAEVRDRAPPFDPFEMEAPDLETAVEDRSVGGLGIHLVRELAEECAYERRGEENRVTISMRVGDGAPG